MNSSQCVAEHWTVTGERLVISGSEVVIDNIVRGLKIPSAGMIRLSKSRAALPLWGNSLDLYLQQYHEADTNTVHDVLEIDEVLVS